MYINSEKYINESEIRKAIDVLKPEGQLFEIRVIDNNTRKILSGYFQDASSCIKALSHTDLQGKNVYITLQRVVTDCKSRSQYNKIIFSKITTSDKEIEAYDWLFIDMDPERTSGSSSSDAELQTAYNTARRVQEYLAGRGFKDPVKAVSGNGAHLLYKIDLENTKENREIVEKCLKVISLYMSDDKCKVDTVNGNPARICKLYGTLAQKGSNTEDRPHRMSRIISVPEKIESTPLAALKKLAKELPESTSSGNSRKYADFDIENWLHEHGLRYTPKSHFDGTTMYILDECPFDPSHKAPDAKVFRYANGRIGFKCWHNSCSGKHWKDVRQIYEPDAYRKAAPPQAARAYTEQQPREQQAHNLLLRDGSLSSKELEKLLREIDPAHNPLYMGCSELDNGILFADVFKSVCRFNVSAKQWFVYDGKRWTKDEAGKRTQSFAQTLTRCLVRYAGDVGDKYYTQGISKLQSLVKRNNMLQDAQSYYKVCADDFDKDPYLFNCQNGVIDLRTLTFQEHDPELMLSKVSNVVYDEKAKSETFQRFIDQIMCEDPELEEYVQQLFGYSLTGENTQEKIFVFHGATTRNGKSTLLDTVRYLFGEYAANAQPETLAKRDRNSSSPSGDIARLAGVRLLQMSEAPKGMNWDAALLKQLTGRDEVTARFLHENDFQFVPVFTMIMNTNYLPVVTDDTIFTSGRMKVIPFDRHFSPEEQDIHLKKKLQSQENLSGIFNWILEGLRKYLSQGEILKDPERVAAATDAYQEQSDKVQLFINECLELRLGETLSGNIVFAEFQRWCAESGLAALGKKNFYESLRKKGLLSKTGTVKGRSEYNVVNNYLLRLETLEN